MAAQTDMIPSTSRKPRQAVVQNAPPKARKKPTTIERMTIENTFRCSLLQVYSPSEIFVRLITDITPSLQYHCPHTLKSDKKPALNKFVMAPLEEHVYGRAQIHDMKTTDEGQFVLVLFIDEGKYDWVHADTLCEIEEQMFYHPIQAIQLSLFGVHCPSTKSSPLGFLDDSEDEEEAEEGGRKTGRNVDDCLWTVEHLERLKKILSDFDEFQIQYIRVKAHMYGRKKPPPTSKMEVFGIVDGKFEAIGPRFAAEAADLGVEYHRDLVFGNYTPNYGTMYPTLPDLKPATIPSWQIKISEDWGEKNKENDVIAPLSYLPGSSARVFDASFTPSEETPSPLVTTFTKRSIHEQFGDDNGRVNMFLVPMKEVSPLEFYAVPVKPDKDGVELKCSDVMGQVLTQRQQFSDMLSSFYIEKQNRVNLKYRLTLEAILSRKRVFAICETPPNESTLVARFRRVFLVDFMLITDDKKLESDPNSWMVKVVFLDYGGTDTVALTSLLQIHSKHCVQEPFAVQLVCPVNEMWPTKTKSNYEQHLAAIFKAVVPTDCIISAKLEETEEKPESGDFDSQLVHLRPNVLVAKHLKEPDREELLDIITGREFERASKDEDRRRENDLPKHLKVKKVGFGPVKRLEFDWVTVAQESEIIERPKTVMATAMSEKEAFFYRANNRR